LPEQLVCLALQTYYQIRPVLLVIPFLQTHQFVLQMLVLLVLLVQPLAQLEALLVPRVPRVPRVLPVLPVLPAPRLLDYLLLNHNRLP
jgi:hypothetical protein